MKRALITGITGQDSASLSKLLLAWFTVTAPGLVGCLMRARCFPRHPFDETLAAILNDARGRAG
jgi:hypothetical protein